MARKKDTPQKAALREMMGNYLKENNVKVKDGEKKSVQVMRRGVRVSTFLHRLHQMADILRIAAI